MQLYFFITPKENFTQQFNYSYIIFHRHIQEAKKLFEMTETVNHRLTVFITISAFFIYNIQSHDKLLLS